MSDTRIVPFASGRELPVTAGVEEYAGSPLFAARAPNDWSARKRAGSGCSGRGISKEWSASGSIEFLREIEGVHELQVGENAEMRLMSGSPDAVCAALQTHPLFVGSPDSVLRALCAQSKLQGYDPGELILEESKEAKNSYVLFEGGVRVFFSSSEGSQVMAKLFSAPAFFGEMESLLGIAYLEGVEVLQPTVVLAIPREALDQALQASHSFCYQLTLDLCARLCVAARNQASLAFADVERRLAAYLIGYLERFGERVDGSLVPSQPITQDAMAEAVGATARSIQRTLNEWKDLGIVKGRGRHFRVLEPQALYRMAGEHPARIDYRIGEVFGRPLQLRTLR